MENGASIEAKRKGAFTTDKSPFWMNIVGQTRRLPGAPYREVENRPILPNTVYAGPHARGVVRWCWGSANRDGPADASSVRRKHWRRCHRPRSASFDERIHELDIVEALGAWG